MADLSLPARDSVAAQKRLFERAASEYGLSIAILAKRNRNLKAATMAGWRDGSAMPAFALGELKTAGVPDELLSLVLEPFAIAAVSEPEDADGDLDAAARAALDFAGEVMGARSANSPGGPSIVPQEKVLIHPKRQRATALMRRAAVA